MATERNSPLATNHGKNRGLKERVLKDKGIEVRTSKAIKVKLKLLYSFFVIEKARKRWLEEKITIIKATENKSVQATWTDEVTSLYVSFRTHGPTYAQITVEHRNIPDTKMEAKMKLFWEERLTELERILEVGA